MTNNTRETKGFQISQFDAYLITLQIIGFQCYVYLSHTIYLLILDLLSDNNHISIYPIFNSTALSSWLYFSLNLLNSITSTFGLMFIVERAKLCLDFVLTYHFLHLLMCWIYQGYFPTNLSWWVNIILSSLILTLGGEFLCMHYELKPIQLVGVHNNTRIEQTSNNNSRESNINSKIENKGSNSKNNEIEDHMPLIEEGIELSNL